MRNDITDKIARLLHDDAEENISYRVENILAEALDEIENLRIEMDNLNRELKYLERNAF